MDTNATAKRIAILDMIDGWPSAAQSMTRESVDAYCKAVDTCGPEAVRKAADRLRDGLVPGQDRRFVPSAAELAEQARVFDEIIARRDEPTQELVIVPIGAPMPEGMVPAGLLTVDFGHGRIDMRNRSHAEQEEILQNKGLPAGKTMLPGLKRMGS